MYAQTIHAHTLHNTTHCISDSFLYLQFWANPHQVLINFQNVSMYDSQLLRKSAHHGTGALDLRAYRCNPRFCLPNWECRKGHHGRLCGLCNNTPVDSKYYAMGSHGCVQCSGTDTYVIWTWIVVLSIFAALLYYLAVWRAWIQVVQNVVAFCATALNFVVAAAFKHETELWTHSLFSLKTSR